MARMDDLIRLAALLALPGLAWVLGRRLPQGPGRLPGAVDDTGFDGIPTSSTEPSSCPPAAAGSPSISPPPPR